MARRVAAVCLLAAGTACADPKPALTVMVPMSDGVRLATDVYLPDGDGPWPVRLVRTPYGRVRYNREYGSQAARGYAMVLQDMRGRFDSGGKDIAFVGSGWGGHQDGVDTVKWILDQPWCDGLVGTEGASAMGITQYLLAPACPPALQAQYLLVAAPSLYHHAAYVGGALRASLVVGWLTDAGFDPDNIWLTTGHPFYDRHWAEYDSIARVDKVRVPGVHFGGWYDVFCQGTIDGFVSRNNHGGPGARGTQKLIIGPWAHGGPQRDRNDGRRGRPLGELRFPVNALSIPHACGGSEWFGYYLKSEETGIEQVPAVQYYTMGAIEEPGAPGNEWHSADNWPVPSEATSFYLHPDGSLSRERPGSPEGAVGYDYNPLDPVPTRGGCLLVLPPGPYDQRDLEQRADVITFTTPPLETPIEVTGNITARLLITSNRRDTDFAVKLCDVYPDGRSMNIADGLARARCRDGFDRLALLEPDTPTLIEVDLWSTSIVFNRGHRIRVSVTSSNYPRFDVNVNTGWPGWPMGPVLTARNNVLCNREHASGIILPVVGHDG
jgi:predicted acyl esterase